MDLNTLLAEIIKAIAWPLTVIISLLLFRSQILSLLPHIRKIKLKAFELEISDQIQSLQSKMNMNPHSVVLARAMSSVPISPRFAVMEAWAELENTAISVLNSSPFKMTAQTMKTLGSPLQQAGVINETQLHIYNELEKLRNKIAHNEELNLTDKDATAFINIANDLVHIIREKLSI